MFKSIVQINERKRGSVLLRIWNKITSSVIRYTAFFVALCIILGSNPALGAFTSTTNSLVMQEKSNWCWAASSVSMIQTKGLARSQTLHVGQAIYGLNYSLVTDAPNVTRTRSSVVGDFSMLYGISVALIGTLSFTTVQLKVNNNIPIYAGVDWNAGGAHAVVISGCDSSGEQLKIFDPSSGIEYCSRSTFLSNYRGLGNWSDSIFWS